ncbi:unnamed protein product [Durusdinium trenchii]|uniref:ADP-ribosylglycohydrolase n=1 Tax=Durusdinium trenchii TaxID=1381693 RepID=A0ABP0R9V9_9DINO
MLGAIAGDVIGSVYEGAGNKIKDFELFGPYNRFTDDTVLTVAVADSILHEASLVDTLHEYFELYPQAGYGGSFIRWAMQRQRSPYNSWGNGSAMRVSPVAYAYDSIESVLHHAKRTADVTHNHPEGVRGSQATALAIYLARTGSKKEQIQREITERFGYDLSTTLESIRDVYEFDVSCQGSVPQSIRCFLEGTDYEDTIRNAISLGGDADTMACIAGGIAEAYWELPEHIAQTTWGLLDDHLRSVIKQFQEKFVHNHTFVRRSMGCVDRQRGCLLGLAVGDALGAAVEFQTPGSFIPVTDYRAGGPHGLGPGEWTDDTSMALALADSIHQAGWDLNDQARRYVSWWRDGQYSVNDVCFDIGNATRAALYEFERNGDARASGNPSPQAAGNGSIMRLAPVPIHFLELFPERLEELAERAAESSLPTHASPQCLSACRYFALILAGLMKGLDRDEVLAPDWEHLEQLRNIAPLHPEVDEVAAGSFRKLQPPEIRGSGYVVKSLEAALWAFHDASDFREAVLKAVNLGDDTDTTGAVCGQLAGAYWGESGIPQNWLQRLARQDMLERALDDIVARA